jgi:hypothetical protein
MSDREFDETEIIIPLWKANIYSFVFFLAALAVFGIPFSFIWSAGHFIAAWRVFLTDYFVLIASIFGGMLLHEVLHAATWAVLGENGLRSISFGINWKNLSPYVHCGEPLRLPSYALGVFMPGLVLGFLPAIVSLFTGSGWLLCFGIFFTAGAAGDCLALIQLRSFPRSAFIIDHPDHLGFTVRASE